jgi:hypothetical protein
VLKPNQRRVRGITGWLEIDDITSAAVALPSHALGREYLLSGSQKCSACLRKGRAVVMYPPPAE